MADIYSGNVVIKSFVNDFRMHNLPVYNKYLDYYKAEHPILQRVKSEGKANARLVFQFPKLIVDTAHSYLLSKPIKYVNNLSEDDEEFKNTEELVDRLTDIFIENDETYHTSEMLKDCAIMGDAYEYIFATKDGDIRMLELPATECYPVYNPADRTELEMLIRVYPMEEILQNGGRKVFFKVETYDKEFITYYVLDGEKLELDIAREGGYQVPHFMGEVPIVHYVNSRIVGQDTGVSDLKDTETLVDEYEERVSDLSNTLQYNGNPYLKLKNTIMDSEQIEQMKDLRVLMLAEGADAEFLTWEQNITALDSHLDRLQEAIFQFSFTPKIYKNGEDGSSLSGVAIKMKFAGADLKANNKERNYTKGIRKRIRLICKLLEFLENKHYNFRDIDIVFSRSIPQNLVELADMIVKLSGTVSEETLLGLLPFVTDIQVEMDRIEQTKQNSMNFDSFNFNGDASGGTGGAGAGQADGTAGQNDGLQGQMQTNMDKMKG